VVLALADDEPQAFALGDRELGLRSVSALDALVERLVRVVGARADRFGGRNQEFERGSAFHVSFVAERVLGFGSLVEGMPGVVLGAGGLVELARVVHEPGLEADSDLAGLLSSLLVGRIHVELRGYEGILRRGPVSCGSHR
jgi:hypothetical protein